MPHKRKLGLDMTTVNTESSDSSYSKKRLLYSERSSWPRDIEKGHSCGTTIYVLLPTVLEELGVAADIITIIQSFIVCTCAFVLNVSPSAFGSLNLIFGKTAWLKDYKGEYYRGTIGENRHWEFFIPVADPVADHYSYNYKGPLKSKSSYITFFAQKQQAHRIAHPNLRQSEIMRDLSKEWITIKDTPVAEPYHEASRKDMARYNRELAEYQLKQNRKLIQIRFTSENLRSFIPTPNSIYNVSSTEIITVK